MAETYKPLTLEEKYLIRDYRRKQASKQSLLEKVVGLFPKPKQPFSLIAESKKIFLDASDYEPVSKPDELRGHIQAMAAKFVEVDDTVYNGWNANMSVDGFVCASAKTHVDTAYAIGVPMCAYIFDNPTWPMNAYASGLKDHVKFPNNLDPRILALRQALKNKTYHAIAIDVERWWKFYNQYIQMIQGKIAGSAVEKIPSTWIRDSAQDLEARILEEMTAGNIRNVPIWYYTGKWFVDAYSPDLDTFLATRIQWLADYTTAVYSGCKGVTTWDKLVSTITSITFNSKWVGNKPANALQLTDAAILPGIYLTNGAAHAVDVNVMLSELSAMFAPGDWGSVTPPPVTPPVTPPVDLTPILARLDAAETVNAAQDVTIKEITAKLAVIKGAL